MVLFFIRSAFLRSILTLVIIGYRFLFFYQKVWFFFQIAQLESKATSAEEYINQLRASFTVTQGNLQDQLVCKETYKLYKSVGIAVDISVGVFVGIAGCCLLLSTHSSLIIGGSPLLLSYGGSPPASPASHLAGLLRRRDPSTNPGPIAWWVSVSN